jgi:Protein of unknown function (DUF1800)
MLNPIASGKWNYDAAAHLALRSGFGEPPAELQKWADQGLDSTLEHLLHTSPPGAAPPDWAYPTRDEDLLQRIRNPGTTPEDRTQLQRQLNERKAEQMANLANWWTQRMYNSPAPLVEKMTLFWHGHFATSAEKVNSYRMWLQNETLRMYALGNFGTLVKAISCDPAMLIWLDLGASQKEHPNENFARELMELFTLGEGNYAENDIKEAARALPATEQMDRHRNFALSPTNSIPPIKLSWGKPDPGEATKLSISFSPTRNAQNSSRPSFGDSSPTKIPNRL